MTSATPSPSQKKRTFRRFAPLLGFLAGAFIFPFALFVFCVGVLHDRGGMLLYPLTGMIAAPFGLMVGLAIRGPDPVSPDEKA